MVETTLPVFYKANALYELTEVHQSFAGYAQGVDKIGLDNSGMHTDCRDLRIAPCNFTSVNDIRYLALSMIGMELADPPGDRMIESTQ